MISQALFRKYYPDNSKSGTLAFYDWLRSYSKNHFKALNVGAGPSADNKIRILKGEVQEVIGADIDSRVTENSDLDRAVVIKDNKLPFSDNTFDLAWSDFVHEHVESPSRYLDEIYRVLKPGASYFFRTPNKYHYVSLIAKATPHWFHELVANKARGISTNTGEIHPTYHRLNSVSVIKEASKSRGFRNTELRLIEAEPSYLMFHPVPFMLGVIYERGVNRCKCLSGIRANILGRLEK